MQPFIVYPWHTYFIFFISIISILFFINKDDYSLFFLGFCLQLGFLFSESYKILSILMILISLVIVFFQKDLFKKRIKKILLIIIGYLLPLILFLVYLYSNNLVEAWVLHSKIPTIFIKELDSNFINLIYNFILRYFFGSLKIISSSYFFLGLLINISCILFLVIFFWKKKINVDLLFIASFSILLNFMLVFRHESFRFFCGPIIGILILFYFIHNNKIDLLKYLVISIVIFIAVISNPFEKGNSNRNFINHSQKTLSFQDRNIKKFRNMNYRKDTWDHLKKFNFLLKNVNLRCQEIDYLYNATPDHYYYLIGTDYLNLFQKIPGYSETTLKDYYDSINNIFDDQIEKKLISEIDKKNVILIRENYNNNFLKINNLEIDLKNYYSIKLPFSYNNKQKLLYIPNNCNLD